MIVRPGPAPAIVTLTSIVTPPLYVPGPIEIVSPLFAAASAGAIWLKAHPLGQTVKVAADACPAVIVAAATASQQTRSGLVVLTIFIVDSSCSVNALPGALQDGEAGAAGVAADW